PTERGLRPPARGGFSHQELDELRRSIAVAIIRRFTPREIRAQILANLRRWKRQGVWMVAYEEWRDIAAGEDDGELFEAMIGRDFILSSRRRHTRLLGDWSSDVCSTDLGRASKNAGSVFLGARPRKSQGRTEHLFRAQRSEERRVGKESGSRWTRDHS